MRTASPRTAPLALAAVLALCAAAPGAPGAPPGGEDNSPNGAPSVTLAPGNGNTYPGLAYFIVNPNGTTIRVKARLVQGRPMPAEIDRGVCGKPGQRQYALHPLKDGDSTTKLTNVKLTDLQDGNHRVRVLDGGREVLCGTIRKPGLFAK